MRFKQFLEQEEWELDIDGDDKQPDDPDLSLLEGFRQNLSIIFERDLFLWRVSNLDDLALLSKVKGRTSDRQSVANSNLLMNIASQWKGFPRRTRSAFATQDASHASDIFDGDLYMVIPADNVKNYAVTRLDLNMSLTDGVYANRKKFAPILTLAQRLMFIGLQSDDEFRHKLENVFDVFGAKFSAEGSSFNLRFVSVVDYFLMHEEDFYGDEDFKYILDQLRIELKSRGFKSLKAVTAEITPENLGVELYHSLHDVPVLTNSSNEIWFEGDYLAFTETKKYDSRWLKAQI